MARRMRLQQENKRECRGRQSCPKNKTVFKALMQWLIPRGELLSKGGLHGNIKWQAEQVAIEALIWAWQETKNVTDAFNQTLEICDDLGLKRIAKTYASLMNALSRYGHLFNDRLRERCQELAEEVGGRFWRIDGRVLMGFDGSRITVPRTVSNETAFCAPNYGKGKRAKYGKKKSKGMRRKRNEEDKPQPQAPQAWMTMIWHMSLRLPWTWRLGPSNSSERGHVNEILQEEEFPENTLFCGDAGFVGYRFWSEILKAGGDFLIRVGANVNLLSEQADVKRSGGGIVLCWPKGRMNSGDPPLRLRVTRVQVGKTKMWMLTNVLSRHELSVKQIVRYYRLRWGIEVEFRGLKQTIDKQKLRCRNSDRLLVELDWSIRAVAVAELLAIREQILPDQDVSSADLYDPKHRSLANTMRTLRTCMRNLNKAPAPDNGLLDQLSRAVVQAYNNTTNKKARYRPNNPDKRPLGDPTIRKLNPTERAQIRKINQNLAA